MSNPSRPGPSPVLGRQSPINKILKSERPPPCLDPPPTHRSSKDCLRTFQFDFETSGSFHADLAGGDPSSGGSDRSGFLLEGSSFFGPDLSRNQRNDVQPDPIPFPRIGFG